MTMMACDAGKDVYVEKPLTLFVREGRWMLEVARRTKRVVQVGTQNRSGPPFQHARELIRQGKLGQIVSASNNNSRNIMPGFGNPPDQAPPPELDYDMFLGPAPETALQSQPFHLSLPLVLGLLRAARRPISASTRWTWCIGCSA